MLKRVALVTCRELPGLPQDDRPLVDELRRFGISATAEIWDDAAVKWTSFDALVLRSTWDYHLRPAEFLAWVAARAAGGAALWNPAPLVLWNSHKFYLRDLGSRGIPVAPTRFLTAGSPAKLADVLDDERWTRAVVKPAVSATAHRTLVVARDGAENRDRELRALLSDGDALVQKYLPEIETKGEWSFVFLDGAFSHAVRKRPAPGDFRVQTEFGGTVEPGPAPPALVGEAGRVVDAIDSPWLYARVDGVESEGRLLLMELELVEPTLYLSSAANAARRLAAAIARIAEREDAGLAPAAATGEI
jgi:glutathione synthase/RimK-type ligase-like ATP-grasp enzyme